jgi:hypothetical protein
MLFLYFVLLNEFDFIFQLFLFVPKLVPSYYFIFQVYHLIYFVSIGSGADTNTLKLRH